MYECKPSPVRRSVALVIACLLGSPLSAAQGGGMSSAPLELIVKFSSTSDAGRRVELLLHEGSQDLGSLADAEVQLETATGVALTRERITSGREIVFSIPERPLLEKVERGVARRADVESVELEALQSGNPFLPSARLRVRFRPSSGAFERVNRAHGDDARADDVRELAAEIGAASGVPVIGVAQPQGVLELVVDRPALLETLSTRVNDLDEVDYAQVNATMQIMK